MDSLRTLWKNCMERLKNWALRNSKLSARDVTAQAICERLVSEPFRSGFQTEDRKRAYIPKFLPYFVDSKLFQLKQNRNRLVPVTLEFVTICDICNQNMTKSVLLKKLKKNPERWPRSQIQNCDVLWPSQMPPIECDWYKTCFCFCLESGLERLLVSADLRFLSPCSVRPQPHHEHCNFQNSCLFAQIFLQSGPSNFVSAQSNK